MKRKWYRLFAGGMAAMVLTGMGYSMPLTGTEVKAAEGSAISVSEFQSPSKTYQPGVRWWWPGGAVEKEELKTEITYLAENGFGTVEINPFDVQTQIVEGTEDAICSIYTDEFYELLDYAITECENYGITVDLNMGSGWNANSQYVGLEDSMGNMALGRNTVAGTDISEINIPSAQKSIFYYGSTQKGTWDDSLVKLQGVLVGELTGNTGEEFKVKSSFTGITSAYNEFQDSEGNTLTYAAPVELNIENSVFVDASDIRISGGTLMLNEEDLVVDSEKNYEVIALYSLPSGGTGVDCATDWYVVDHLDGAKTAEYINNWLGDAAVSAILNKHSNIRAVFNDSYEFYSDIYYTDGLYDLAQDADNNGLGYDFTKYLPTVYKEYSAAPFYMGLGTSDTFLTYTLDAGEKTRIQYDYNTLIGQKFAEGMAGFQEAANSKGLLYRQEAYNPPIDTIGSAENVDIPEGEQGNEMSLIRVASGAHLYGKNLVTCEQYTLGCTPFKNTLEQVKIGYDNMATSGVNNFFYHGFNYMYGKDTDLYGENAWSPMASIGINVSEMNTLSPYMSEMNAYASRVNYLMQQGNASKDVAYYMPYNGSLSENDVVKAMNYNGIAWDAINDASIQADNTTFQNGVISANGGNMEYDAIVVDAASVPLETMQKLQTFAEQGANIIFYGAAPAAQPGFADGNYADADAQVAAVSSEMSAYENVNIAQDMNSFGEILRADTNPQVTYEYNENVRFARRTLDDGGELVYIRNIGTESNEITIQTNGSYQNYYWMDQSTGEIYPAAVEDGRATFTMGASKDTYSNKNSMSVVLLCEPDGAAFDETTLSSGLPVSIETAALEGVQAVELNMESLTVTADNLDGVIGGEETTVSYTENVLGKWNDAAFHDGQLMKVVADGTYKTSYSIDEKKEKVTSAVLKLNEVYTAATIYVNGEEAGKLMYAPYELDITSQLKTGNNEIEIVVTPRKYNRYYNEANGQYQTTELLDAGMAGPVNLEVLKEEVKEPTPDPDKPAITDPEKPGTTNPEKPDTTKPGTTDSGNKNTAVETGKAGVVKTGDTQNIWIPICTMGAALLAGGAAFVVYLRKNR